MTASEHSYEIKSNLLAQYQNVLIPATKLATIRGSGEWETGNPFNSDWREGLGPNQILKEKKVVHPDKSSYLTSHVKLFPNAWESDTYNINTQAPVGNYIPNNWGNLNTPKGSFTGNASTQFALKSLQTTPTTLLTFLFSKENIDHLHKQIITTIQQLRGITIKRQSDDDLQIIMRAQYEYALSGALPQPSNPLLPHARGGVNIPLIERLRRLNNSVLQITVKQILGGIDAYLQYYKDSSSLPIPLSLPVQTTMKGSRVLQYNTGLYSGNTRGVTSFNERCNIIN